MKKTLIILFSLVFMTACSTYKRDVTSKKEPTQLNQLLDDWHKDVATFKYDAYFEIMATNAVFVGTDATEVWSKEEFMVFSKPFFDKKQTWDFKPLDRNIYFGKDNKTAWFDETLDTWMGICRGSGVLINIDGKWKIAHYVLSLTVPNKDMNAVIGLIKERDGL